MDDYFTVPSCPTDKMKGGTGQLADGGDGRTFAYEKFIQKSEWKADSGNGTRSGRAGGTKSFRKNGKPPRPPRSSSDVCCKIQKPPSHVTQCEIVLRRSKIEGRSSTVKEKTSASAVIFNALWALLVTVCFILLTIGPGVLPNKFLAFAQIKALPQIIQNQLLINGSAEFKMESLQYENLNLRALYGYPLLDLFNSAAEKPFEYKPKAGSQMNMAAAQPIKRAVPARNRKVRFSKKQP